VKRVRLRVVRGVEVEFVDREVALRQLREIAERGTRFPLVVYGPEGCGKTALLRQAVEVFKEWGYSVVYVNPLGEVAERLVATDDLRNAVKRTWREELGGVVNPAAPALVDLALAVASRALKRGKKRVAILADDVFQAVGVHRAEQLVKSVLNIIEYPPAGYDSVVAIVASSEGVTRSRVGRHDWASLRLMWNMSREGFEELYRAMPGPKPPFNEVWRWTGGNPRYLGRLYEAGWDPAAVARDVAKARGLWDFVKRLGAREVEWLRRAVEDPDALYDSEAPGALVEGLVEMNLVVRLWDRDPFVPTASLRLMSSHIVSAAGTSVSPIRTG